MKKLNKVILGICTSLLLLSGCSMASANVEFDTADAADEAKEALDSICKEKIEYDESQRVCEKGEVIFFIPFNHLY